MLKQQLEPKKVILKKIKARFPAKIEWDLTNRPLGPVSCYIELLDTQVFFARSIQWRFLGQIWPWPLQFVQNQPRKVPTLQQNNQKIQSRGVPNNQNPWPPKKITKMISILLMEDILHQLRLVVFPIIYRVLYIPGGCLGFLPSTVSLTSLSLPRAPISLSIYVNFNCEYIPGPSSLGAPWFHFRVSIHFPLGV